MTKLGISQSCSSATNKYVNGKCDTNIHLKIHNTSGLEYME